MLRSFLLLSSLFICCCALSQQRYLFAHLGPADGMSSEQTLESQQDKQGFIWIGTTNGLQRYDGNRFITFHHSESNAKSIPSDKIFQLKLDGKNRLWMICPGEKTGYFDVTDFTYHEVPVRVQPGAMKNRYRRYQLDNDGNIILVVERINTFTFNEQKNEFADEYNPFSIPHGWKLQYLHQDKVNNNYWLGCDSGLAKYDVKEKKLSYRGHNVQNDPVVNAYSDIKSISFPYLDKSGRFWMYSWPLTGPGPYVRSYDTKSGKTIQWEDVIARKLNYTYFEVFGIMEQKNGTVWLLGESLMMKIDSASEKYQYIDNNAPGEFNIRYDVVRGMMEDREDNLWVTTNKGMFRFNPSGQLFKTIPNTRPGRDSVHTADVTDLLEAKSGELIVATWGSGLFAYDTNLMPLNKSYLEESVKRKEGLVWCIHQRANGDIWRGNQEGVLYIYYAATGKNERLELPVFEKATIRQIAEDNAGNLWLGTQGGKIIRWDAATNVFTKVLDLKSVVQRLYKDNAGKIWACTTMEGLYKINPANTSIEKHYTGDAQPGKKLSDDGAVDIVQYNDSLFMIASYGLNILNIRTDSIKHLTTGNGLPSNETTNIIKDRQGLLWLTAETGLISYDYENEILSSYDAAGGIQTNSFHESSINLLPDGCIAIGTVHDFLIFNPAEINKGKTIPPDVHITGFSLANKWLPMDSILKLKLVDLPYDRTSVVIEFSMLTYFSRYGVSYMMEGLDKDWVSPGAVSQVTYNALPPGKYTFKVRGENGKGIYSKNVTEFWIEVKAPFWQSWWFYCLIGLLIALLLYWFDKERVSRLRTVYKTRSDIAVNLHNEVNAALSNINVLSEIARMKADNNPEQTKDYITEIHNKSHNMIIAMDDMLWSIDPSNDSMGKLLDRMKEFADALQTRYEADIDVNADSKIFPLKPDMRTRYELILIYKLALRMLIEQLKAQHTVVQMEYERSSLEMTIFSNNITLPENNNAVKTMITEMEKDAASINASFAIHSDDKKTVITIGVRM